MGKPTKKGKTTKNVATKRQKNKEAMKAFRDAVRNDPVRYEEAKAKERERYHARKLAGKLKSVSEMNEREQRSIRKKWRERSKRCYEGRKQRNNLDRALEEQTPPNTPRYSPLLQNIANDIPIINETPPGPSTSSLMNVYNFTSTGSSRVKAGQKMRKKNRQQLKLQIKMLERKLKAATKSKEKYKKRVHRLKKEIVNDNSPGKEVNKLLCGQNVPKEVKKRLLFGEVISRQIKENFKQQVGVKQKRRFIENISGKIITKYGYARHIGTLSSRNIIFGKKSERERIRKNIFVVKKRVADFFEKDENTRLCPGKKDTITFKKIKKQKRYLNDTLRNIHKKFLTCYPQYKISYSTFCKLRPFWVLQPNVQSRNTCLCCKCANMSMITSKLKYLNIIKEGSPTEVKKALCCPGAYTKDNCLERKCLDCKNKEVAIPQYNKEENTFYEKWLTTSKIIVIKGKEKKCKRTVKERVYCKKSEVVTAFKSSIQSFLLHVRNVSHQYKATDDIKKDLSTRDVLIHMDFSENYVCKYSQEVQSAHFGSSKPQVTLHTVVVYYKCPDKETIKPMSICTLSDSLRHDPAAICAHLQLVIDEIKKIIPDVQTVHFLSDGPTTQYRNKTMFHLMGTYLVEKMGVKELRWHYSESGHGKGAPDGVGGTIKRTADRLVATGRDIPNFETLTEELQGCTGIKVIALNADKIAEIDEKIPKEIRTFPGTLKVHEVCWSQENNKFLKLRELTCSQCPAQQDCTHYGLGEVEIHSAVSEADSILFFCSTLVIFENYVYLLNPLLDTVDTIHVNQDRVHYHDVYSSDDHSHDSDDDLPLVRYQKKNSVDIIKENMFVVVKLSGKKIVRHYVARIDSVDDSDEFTVKFLKKTGNKSFIFPEREDVSVIDRLAIMLILSQPDFNKINDEYSFKDDLKSFKDIY